MKILAAAIVAFCVLTVPPEPVAAQFELVEEVRLDRPEIPPDEPFAPFNSVAFDGENYWVGRRDRTVLRYDAMFNLIEEIDIPISFGDLRTVDVDRENGNLLVLINSNRVLTEFTPDFEIVHQYSTIQEDTSATAGVALDPITNTTWAAGVFTGVVTQYSREGLELSSFQADIDLTENESFNSIAIDWVNETVLLFDPLPDRLEEYTFDGEFVGTPFLTEIDAEGNFFRLHTDLNIFTNGIYYDSETARLYAIGTGGELAIWEDLSRLGFGGGSCEQVAASRGIQVDLDGNGTVEFNDFLVLSVNFSQNVSTYETGDINCNTVVEFDDFLVLSGNFGQSAAAASVPEPTSNVLAMLSAFLMLPFRKKRKSKLMMLERYNKTTVSVQDKRI